MRVLRYWRIGIGAAVALSVGAALAADPAPVYPECTHKASPQDNEAAKNAHKVATQLYAQGNYDKAIRYWNDAYGFDCTVNDLLINISNAYEKKGDRPGAIATLEAYLKRTGPNSDIEAKVANLKAALAPAPTATAAPTVAPTVTAPPTATAPPPPPPPPPADGVRPHGSTPWIVVGGGGAVALVGVIVLAVGLGTYSTAEAACPTHVGCTGTVTDQGNTGNAEVHAGGALLGIGLAAAAGGLVWQLGFNKPGARAGSGLWVKPMGGLGSSGAPSGMMVGGSF